MYTYIQIHRKISGGICSKVFTVMSEWNMIVLFFASLVYSSFFSMYTYYFCDNKVIKKLSSF